MKAFRLIIATIAFAITTASQSAPKIEWVENKYDFGVFNEDKGKVSCSFHAINIGDEPLVIVGARATCGCTVPTYDKDAIAPGDTAVVEVTYNASGRPGKFSKKVYIDTNTDPRRSTLTITGTVIGSEKSVRNRFPIDAGAMKLRTTTIPFGEIDKGKTKTAFIEAYNQSTDTLYPSFSNIPKHLRVVSNNVVPPGEQTTFTVFYVSSDKNDWGLCYDNLTLRPDASTDSTINISVAAHIKEDFSNLTAEQLANAPKATITPDRLDFGRIKHGDILTATLSIENYGNDPLIIRKVNSPDKHGGITLKLDKHKIKKGKRAKIKITIDTSLCDKSMLNSRINIITNNPERPQATVRIVGEFIK